MVVSSSEKRTVPSEDDVPDARGVTPLRERRRLDQRPWVNPYVLAVRRFPERLYPLDDEEGDIASLRFRTAGGQPIVIELGSGSGAHLISRASESPDRLFIGFELRFKRATRTIEKADRLGVRNLIVVRGDARRFPDVVREHSVERIYVNFPDPWEKRKRWKHRLLGEWLLDAAARTLAQSGDISVKTDHAEYLEWFREDAARDSRFVIAEATNDLHGSELAAGNVLTEFEKLFRSQNLPIHYMRLRRAGCAAS